VCGGEGEGEAAGMQTIYCEAGAGGRRGPCLPLLKQGRCGCRAWAKEEPSVPRPRRGQTVAMAA
jgi:hypothetical protein